SQSVPLTFNLPFDETQTAGDYFLIVQTDSKSVLAEGDGASITAATGPIHLTLPPLPDLAVSNVAAPDQKIADPATVTVSWTVTTTGEGTGKVGAWVGQPVLTKTRTPGPPKAVIFGPFPPSALLAPGGATSSASQSITLPPGFTGRYPLFVETDAKDQVL